MSQHPQRFKDAAVQWRLAPRPARDESLSSWIERVGLFYGVEYDTWVSGLLSIAGDVPLPRQHDVDADESLRMTISGLTGVSLSQIPVALPCSSPSVLPLPERGTFCALCWDEDASTGGQPYVRRSWSFWNCVSCVKHSVFLSARHRIGLKVARHTLSWMPLWHSRRLWAQVFDSPYDRSLRESALWYSPDRLNALSPTVVAKFTAESARLSACENPDGVAGKGREGPRRALQALAITLTPEFRAISDDIRHDLFGFPADSPAKRGNFDSASYVGVTAPPHLLENRMALLVTAVEVLRRMEAQPCISPIIERIIERSCYVRRTVDKDFAADYLLAWPAAERQAFLASWWDRREVSLKDRESLTTSPRRRGARIVGFDYSVSRIMRVNHATH